MMRYVRNSKGKVFDSIQEGINDIGSDGGWVEASVGTFTENITIRQSNIILRRQGYGTVLGHTDYSRSVILVWGASNQFVISDIRVLNVSSGTAIRVLSGSEGGLLNNLYITEAGQDGIQLSGVTSVKLNNCNIANIGRHALSIANSCGVLVVKNYMGNAWVSGSMINISGGGGHIISDNFLTNFGASSGIGVVIGASANNVTLTSNRIAGFSTGFSDNGTNTICGLNNIS